MQLKYRAIRDAIEEQCQLVLQRMGSSGDLAQQEAAAAPDALRMLAKFVWAHHLKGREQVRWGL